MGWGVAEVTRSVSVVQTVQPGTHEEGSTGMVFAAKGGPTTQGVCFWIKAAGWRCAVQLLVVLLVGDLMPGVLGRALLVQ